MVKSAYNEPEADLLLLVEKIEVYEAGIEIQPTPVVRALQQKTSSNALG